MKMIALIARILLGLIFLTSGLMGLLTHMPKQTIPGVGGVFFGILLSTRYFYVIKCIEVTGAAMLLLNRYVALGLVLLGPVIVNIFLFHALMAPGMLPLAIVLVVLWGIQFWFRKKSFAGVLASNG
jgi:putative oxidoreductase